MSISLNYYLDNAISKHKLDKIQSAGNKDEKEQLKKDISSPKQIFLYVRVSNERIKISVRRKVTQRQWDSDKQRVNARLYKMGVVELNSYLQNIELRVTKEHETLLPKSSITKNKIKTILDELNNVKKPVTKVFFDFMEDWIKDSKNKIYRKTGKTIGANQLRDYRNTLGVIKDFSTSWNPIINFSDISNEFYNAFHDLTINLKGKSPNTFGKYIKHLKIFMKWAEDKGHITDTTYRSFEVPNNYKTEEIIALNSQELLRLRDISFSNRITKSQLSQIISDDFRRSLTKEKFNAHLRNPEITRDYFVGMCSSGAHISDFYDLKMSDIKKGDKHNYLEYVRSKTGEKCTGIFYKNEKYFALPLIFKKYYNPEYDTIFPRFSQINKYLKYLQE